MRDYDYEGPEINVLSSRRSRSQRDRVCNYCHKLIHRRQLYERISIINDDGKFEQIDIHPFGGRCVWVEEED